MVAKLIGIVHQPTVMRLVSGLRPARARILTFLLLVRRRRLGRCAGVLRRPLKPKHQLDQLLLAQLLQIGPIHPHMDSEIETRGKGVGSYPFQKGYIVDVLADIVDGVPKLYRIIELHQVIELGD